MKPVLVTRICCKPKYPFNQLLTAFWMHFLLVCCPEEGADPESIEKVAQHVLSITLPVNRTSMDKLVKQIKDSLSNLTDVEGIFNQTSQQLIKAKDLLDRAKDAK